MALLQWVCSAERATQLTSARAATVSSGSVAPEVVDQDLADLAAMGEEPEMACASDLHVLGPGDRRRRLLRPGRR